MAAALRSSILAGLFVFGMGCSGGTNGDQGVASGAPGSGGGDTARGSTGSGGGSVSSSGFGGSRSQFSSFGSTSFGSGGGSGLDDHVIKTAFIILMENQAWSNIKDNDDAPFINDTILPLSSYAENYRNPLENHPSETNYIWLEAGSNLGITNDDPPSDNHQSTVKHLVTLLNDAGITWKSYQEGIDGTTCPLENDSSNDYAVRHNPMVFFDDVSDFGDPFSSYCIEHVRPYSELAADLANGTVAQYNFITPSLCHDMHGVSPGCLLPHVSSGDDWLSTAVPPIYNSTAFEEGGALFITWDECSTFDGLNECEDPIGMIVLSPFAWGGGYNNQILYDHSSTLRTFQEIFEVSPFLRGAQNASDLSDLFETFP